MKKIVTVIGAVSLTLSLAACQDLNAEMTKLNGKLSELNNGLQHPSTVVSNNSSHRVSHNVNPTMTQAIEWLHQDHPSWDDNGKFQVDSWYRYWARQVHFKTAINKQADKYCNAPAWSSEKKGDNCMIYQEAQLNTNISDHPIGKK